MSAWRAGRFLLALCLAVLCGACATTAGSGGASAGASTSTSQRIDPWENWNRKVFAFNDAIDRAVLKPVATAYTKVVPEPVRRGVSNFFGNFSDAWSAVNNFLQGKITNGFQDVMRVGTNTVFGLGGVFDVASQFGLDRQNEDLGQTLGRWGFGPGPYVVWPLLGPSTLRDSFALPLDRSASPTLVAETDALRATLVGVNVVDQRASLLGATSMLDDVALDRYVFARDAFLQRRQSLVYDGDVPASPADDDYLDEEDDAGGPGEGAATVPSQAASAPVAPAVPAPVSPSASSPAGTPPARQPAGDAPVAPAAASAPGAAASAAVPAQGRPVSPSASGR